MSTVAIIAGLVLLIATGARAQQTPPTAPSPQQLVEFAHNPVEPGYKISFEADTFFNEGKYHKVGETVHTLPTFPFSLNPDWELLVRPLLLASYSPKYSANVGLNDMLTTFYLTPAKTKNWSWGVGPVFQFPTATSHQLGSDRWSVGPAAGVTYVNGPWYAGIVSNQLMSFAGDRRSGSINRTFLEPNVSYNFPSGRYFQIDPLIFYEWTATKANAWIVPVGADVGSHFSIGSQHLVAQIGAYDFVKHPADNPQWVIRTAITFLFPNVR